MARDLGDHFNPEFEPVIFSLAVLNRPAQQDAAYRFGSNDFFLMRALIPRSKEEPKPRIGQTSLVSKVLLEVLRSADKLPSDGLDKAEAFLGIEAKAIGNVLTQQARIKQATTALAGSELDRVFRTFNDFMDERHGIDFVDLIGRTHNFGRLVVYRAVTYSASPEEPSGAVDEGAA